MYCKMKLEIFITPHPDVCNYALLPSGKVEFQLLLISSSRMEFQDSIQVLYTLKVLTILLIVYDIYAYLISI